MTAGVPVRDSVASTAEVAVIIPLEDPRGDIAEHIATWTRGQTLPRDRYQVVVSADGEHPDFERGVAELLAPQDQLVIAPGASFTELYGAAAREARAPVLVITEAHCRAEPGCLAAVADAFAADADLAGVTFETRQSASNTVAELTERWMARALGAWDQAGWPRLNFAGSAIRTDAYLRAGGLDPRLELYAPSLMSARLHQEGARFVHLEGAAVTHKLEEGIPEALAATRSFARGECVVRSEHDPEFCGRYFGSAGVWGRRLGYRPEIARTMARAIISAAWRSPRDSRWLARELVTRLPAVVGGTNPRGAWERATARWHQALAATAVLPIESRWASYQEAQERTVRSVQLRSASNEDSLPPPLEASGGALRVERLDDVLVGAHDVERLDGRPFRWTDPVTLLRLAPPAEGAVLRVETSGLRGAPLDYLQGIHLGGRRLPPALISGNAETLELRLPTEYSRDVAGRGIVLLCHPLVPSREGSSDRRRLGMPVTRLELSAA
jgi:hypothetical protein